MNLINSVRLNTKVLLAVLFFTTQLSFAGDSNKPAPDFTLASNHGDNLRLEELRGQVVLLNFWASWCGPCRQEMPILEEIHQRYEAAGFTVIGVNVDKDANKANRILKDLQISFPVLYDTDGKVSGLFDVAAMPSTIMIDRNGTMRYLHAGYKPGYEDQYREQIVRLIKE